MTLRLIDNWKRELHRLWSIRFSLTLGVFTAVASCISLFADVFNPWLLLSICIVSNIAIIPLSRLVKQAEPGGDE